CRHGQGPRGSAAAPASCPPSRVRSCPATSFRFARGVEKTTVPGYFAVPLRRRDLSPGRQVPELARGQVAHALWYGSVPGTRLWCGSRVPASLEYRVGSAAAI